MKLEYHSDTSRRETLESHFMGGRYRDREDAVRFLMGGWTVPYRRCKLPGAFVFFASLPDSPLHSSDLYFCLGDCRSILLPCSCFCLRDECEGDNVGPVPPVVAHIDHGHIVWMREMKMIQSYNGIRSHRPSASSAEIKMQRLASREPLHEPYLVALLIALA